VTHPIKGVIEKGGHSKNQEAKPEMFRSKENVAAEVIYGLTHSLEEGEWVFAFNSTPRGIPFGHLKTHGTEAGAYVT